MIEPFDPRSLCYRWHNADGRLDALCAALQESIKRDERRRKSRWEIFRTIWELAQAGRVSSGRAHGLAGDYSLSHGALVLLSGAYGRAVSSCISNLNIGDRRR